MGIIQPSFKVWFFENFKSFAVPKGFAKSEIFQEMTIKYYLKSVWRNYRVYFLFILTC